MHKNAIKLFVGLKIMCGLQKCGSFQGKIFADFLHTFLDKLGARLKKKKFLEFSSFLDKEFPQGILITVT